MITTEKEFLKAFGENTWPYFAMEGIKYETMSGLKKAIRLCYDGDENWIKQVEGNIPWLINVLREGKKPLLFDMKAVVADIYNNKGKLKVEKDYFPLPISKQINSFYKSKEVLNLYAPNELLQKL